MDEKLYLIPLLKNTVTIESINGTHFIKRANNHKIQKIVRFFGFNIPRYTTLELDEFSACVINNINGKNTINDILNILICTYPETQTQHYDRIFTFFNILTKKYKLISFVKQV